ncbi:MAG TPA: RsmE family RNA methyltransferase [Luteitalea sp.]|nr:RsmE family RNA methyltransferase [Luteitalea sp.]
MPPRFHAPALDIDQPTVTLPPGESQHLTRVLRLGSGADVEIFDGRGGLHSGRVQVADGRAAIVSVGAPLEATPEPGAPIVIVQGLLKGDGMDAVVRDATMMGATTIQPVTSARTNVPGRSAAAAGERWQRVAVAAAKQCGRAVLPTIAPVARLDDVLDATETASRLWLCEPAIGDASATAVPPATSALWLAIGPEGGWTTNEVAAARAAGWSLWTLAPVTLRAEQVTLAALAVVRHAWSAVRRIT